MKAYFELCNEKERRQCLCVCASRMWENVSRFPYRFETYVCKFDHKISRTMGIREHILTNSLQVHHACRIKDIERLYSWSWSVHKRYEFTLSRSYSSMQMGWLCGVCVQKLKNIHTQNRSQCGQRNKIYSEKCLHWFSTTICKAMQKDLMNRYGCSRCFKGL